MTGTTTTAGTGSAAMSGEVLVSVDEARRRLGGCSRTTIYKLAAEGRLRLARVDGMRKTLVVGSTLDALIAKSVADAVADVAGGTP
jgi:excisionase family DNA binding protein